MTRQRPCGHALRRLPGSRGFTLVEVMAAAGIFMVGLVGVIGMSTAAAGHMALASHKERATELAGSLVELCKVMPLDELAAMKTPVVSNFDPHGGSLERGSKGYFTATTSVASVATGANPVLQVRSVVVWAEGITHQTQQVSVETQLLAAPL